MALPQTADIFADRASRKISKDQLESIAEDLKGRLYDGDLTPDNNLAYEPIAFYIFPDGSRAGVSGTYDIHGQQDGWEAWNRRDHRDEPDAGGDLRYEDVKP